MISVVRFVKIVLVSLVVLSFTFVQNVSAATSPNLGAADSFSVLGSSGVTNDGTTTISGDLGVSPGTSITNGGVLTIGGATHNNDVTSIQAHTDAASADASMLSQGSTSSIGPALDGLNLVPGVYDIGAGRLNGGVLTLNGQGVYIFRASSDFISSGSINFTNGARACDLYWDVQTQATINGTSFAGTIVAGSGVVFGEGVSLDGRALVFGGTGPVTMIGNTISGPSCAAITSTSTSNNTPSNTSSGIPYQVCIPTAEINTIPTIITSKRLSPTSVSITWGPYAGFSEFNVRYGKTNGEWLYNYDFSGFTATIDQLPPTQPFWFEVAAKNNCTIGSYGQPTLVGGPSLPNTGFVPHTNEILKYVWNFIDRLLK